MSYTFLVCLVVCFAAIHGQYVRPSTTRQPQNYETTQQQQNYEESSTVPASTSGSYGKTSPVPTQASTTRSYGKTSSGGNTPIVTMPTRPSTTGSYGKMTTTKKPVRYGPTTTMRPQSTTAKVLSSTTAAPKPPVEEEQEGCGPCPLPDLVRNCNQSCQDDDDCPGKEFCCESNHCNGQKVCRKLARPIDRESKNQQHKYVDEYNPGKNNKSDNITMDELKKYAEQYKSEREKEYKENPHSSMNMTDTGNYEQGMNNTSSNEGGVSADDLRKYVDEYNRKREQEYKNQNGGNGGQNNDNDDNDDN